MKKTSAWIEMLVAIRSTFTLNRCVLVLQKIIRRVPTTAEICLTTIETAMEAAVAITINIPKSSVEWDSLISTTSMSGTHITTTIVRETEQSMSLDPPPHITTATNREINSTSPITIISNRAAIVRPINKRMARSLTDGVTLACRTTRHMGLGQLVYTGGRPIQITGIPTLVPSSRHTQDSKPTRDSSLVINTIRAFAATIDKKRRAIALHSSS